MCRRSEIIRQLCNDIYCILCNSCVKVKDCVNYLKSHYTRRCSNPSCAIDIPSTYQLSDSICSGYKDEAEYIPDTTCLTFESSSVQYTLSGIHMHDCTQSLLFAKSIMNWILQVFDNSVGYIIHLRPSSMCKRISDMISSL
jgi:hypothetical protein